MGWGGGGERERERGREGGREGGWVGGREGVFSAQINMIKVASLPLLYYYFNYLQCLI